MRLFTLFAGLNLAWLVSLPLTASAENDWNGAWTGYVCPEGSAVNPARCASLFLRLYSRNAKVCGSHVFATAGAKEMDEGATPSIMATLDGTSAKGTVQSTRASPPLSIPLSMQLQNSALRWQLGGSAEGDYLLPRNLSLTHARQGGMLSALFEQRLSASCAAWLDMPVNKPAVPQPHNPVNPPNPPPAAR